MKSRAASHAQHGLSLVELMVATVIGLVVVAGVAAIHAGLRGTAAVQEGLGALHDSERIALMLLPQFVRQAGFRPDPFSSSLADAFPAESVPGLDKLAAGQVLGGTRGRGTVSDSITLRFLADGDGVARDCTGNGSYARGALVTVRLVVSPGRQLNCKIGKSDVQPLVDKVVRMDVLYAVDAVAGCEGCDRRYLDADQVTAADAWGRVRLLRIGLTFEVPRGEPPTLQWQQNVALMNP